MLKHDDRLILQILGKFGKLNLTEIGQITSKRARGFDRWGVKNRLCGTSYFLGLIKNDYITDIPINKKETQYSLSIKGLLASLASINFEDNYLIDKYKFVLMQFMSEKYSRIIMDFIKHEIVYLLYYNYIQGIDWTKFHYLKPHLQKIRNTTNGHFHLDLEIDEEIINEQSEPTLFKIRSEYGKMYKNCLFLFPYMNPKQVFRTFVKNLLQNKTTKIQIKNKIASYLLSRFWFHYMGILSKDSNLSELNLVADYCDITNYDFREDILRLKRSEIKKLVNLKEFQPFLPTGFLVEH